jgi:IMP dehydrogenase
MKQALTYDDIQLVPKYSDITSRSSVSLKTLVSRRYGLLRPIVASPMDTVCGFDMALKMARLGGVGCVHRFMSIEEQCEVVRMLQNMIYNINSDAIYDDWGVNYDNWHAEMQLVPIMAAVGVRDEDRIRATELVKSGANIILIDVAHGHHLNVIRMIEWCKKNLPERVDVIAGSIATAKAAIDLENAGADGLRVGVGGGSLCTTRIKTGFGIPNVTSLEEIIEVARVPVIADGGIRNSGDIAKALALGADCVMLGSLLAGTTEAPGNTIYSDNGLYKEYRGSASKSAKQSNGYSTTNVEGEQTRLPYKGDAEIIFNDLIDGVKSALSYAGAVTLNEYCPEYVVVTNSGVREASAHLLKPNY